MSNVQYIKFIDFFYPLLENFYCLNIIELILKVKLKKY